MYAILQIDEDGDTTILTKSFTSKKNGHYNVFSLFEYIGKYFDIKFFESYGKALDYLEQVIFPQYIDEDVFFEIREYFKVNIKKED